MAHPSQWHYCDAVHQLFPEQFSNSRVLDVGSLDINGCNKPHFNNCIYTGLDIGPGPNVDVISKGHEYWAADEAFDTIISTECFEHDKYVAQTLQNIIRMLRPEGLFVFTCATTGRPEHGTRRTDTYSSPLTTTVTEEEDWGDYYRNLTEEDFREMLDFNKIFSKYEFNVEGTDIRFWGIKRSRVIDCIMLSYTKDAYLHNMTQNAINSLQLSSTYYKFNVFVVETSHDPVHYQNATVIQPKVPFNYNAYLNMAFPLCKSDRIIIANNDMVFHRNWYDNIVLVNADSASPSDPSSSIHAQIINTANQIEWGYWIGCLCGWCLVVKKTVIDTLYPFDERFEFYCQDVDYAMRLRAHGFNHALVGSSCAHHLISRSYDIIDPADVSRFLDGGRAAFYEKYPEELVNRTM